MQKNKAYVYRHRRLDTNEIFYVGIGSIKNFRRAYDRKQRNLHWTRITEKHNYEVEIIQDNISWENACELEIFLISLYGRRDLGLGNLVNMTDGGEGSLGSIFTEEHRKKISASNSGVKHHFFGKKHSTEFKSLMSLRMSGVNHPMYGRKGKLNPIFGKEGKSNFGIDNHFYGKKHSVESKRLISEKRKGTIQPKCGGSSSSKIILDFETGIFYDCVREASNIYNIKHSTLIAQLRGQNKNKTSLIYC